MDQCKEIRTQITFYLDDELQICERSVLEKHLRSCDACREIFTLEQRFLEKIRASRPIHAAPPELRAQVETFLNASTEPRGLPAELRPGIRRQRWALFSTTSQPINARRLVAMIALVIAGVLLTLWLVSVHTHSTRAGRPSEFAMMAVDTHQRHQRGQLPLEVTSATPEQISTWFAGKVPFGLKLPNYQESSGQEKLYELEGGRLVGYKSDYAAYVAYEMHTRPISLVVTGEDVAQPSGGEEIVSNGITFHYDSIDGLKVITWSDGGLTYALVSDLEERGQESCIVCHQGTKDHDFIESLKPK